MRGINKMSALIYFAGGVIIGVLITVAFWYWIEERNAKMEDDEDE